MWDGNFPPNRTFLSPLIHRPRSEEITLCNPCTVNRDQILEISATRLHILRLQTRVAPGCLPWRCCFFFFMPTENPSSFCSHLSLVHRKYCQWYHTDQDFPLLYFPLLVFSLLVLVGVCCVCVPRSGACGR